MADKPKFPLSRRSFLQGLGALVVAPFAGSAVKTATKVAPKVVPEMSAPGMPNWFPLLVNRIKTEGKQTMFAGSKKQPTDSWKYSDKQGNEYILREDAISGEIEVVRDLIS